MHTQKDSIQANLENALLHNAALSDEMYDKVLSDFIDQMKESLQWDADDALICIVADTNQAAMMLVEADSKIWRNDAARRRLEKVWKESYEINVLKVIPMLAEHLSQGMLGVAGIKVIRST